MENAESKVDFFLEVIFIEKNVAKNTIESYKRDLNHFISFFCNKDVKNLSTQNITEYLLALKKKYSISSISRKISVLKSYYKFLNSENIITINPMLKLENFKQKRPLPNYLTKEDMEKLLHYSSSLKSFNGIRNNAILEILYATGMRVSEVISLKISDILPLFKEMSHITICGKGGRERIIIFNEKAIKAIKVYVELLKNNNNKWLFVTKNNANSKPITRQCIGIILKKIAINSNVDPIKIHPHVIRHSFATHLLNAGMKIKIIKELLGHKSISTTQIYTHVANDKLKEILEDNHPFSNQILIK